MKIRVSSKRTGLGSTLHGSLSLRLKATSASQRRLHYATSRTCCKQKQILRSNLSANNRWSSLRLRVSVGESETRSEEQFHVLVPFNEATSPNDKLKMLIEKGRSLKPFPPSDQIIDNRVMGCTTRTYLKVLQAADGCIHFSATSDSEITKGLIALLTEVLSGSTIDSVLKFNPESFTCVLALPGFMTPSRTNGFLNLVETLKRKTRTLVKSFPRFPSLLVTSSKLIPQGTFAETQVQFLEPDLKAARELGMLLKRKRVGVVAHFYMDAEIQGMLSEATHVWPNICISDSLVMADSAVKMADAGCRHIAVLGVDFMSENVRIILDKYGHSKVFRMSSEQIGCSLAEAAESSKYNDYLRKASKSSNPSLHVIYINTSLLTKAKSQSILPTITCTSGNVVRTILQAAVQVENLHVAFGPDTYMGANLKEMFRRLSDLPNEQIRELHPQHNKESIRFEYFRDGTCIVHHLFGGEVCEIVKEAYGDAYITAHFEVPGEMFGLAMEARKRRMGVVGSTANILDFIKSVVKDQASNRTTDRLQFVLGTESGMISSIVNEVKTLLVENASLEDLEVEIVFPVSSKAVTTMKQSSEEPVVIPDALKIVPGPAAGEGCSSEGGCANCPYMKMNTLDALRRVVDEIEDDTTVQSRLNALAPKQSKDITQSSEEKKLNVEEMGSLPILHMRHFQREGELSQELVEAIRAKDRKLLDNNNLLDDLSAR